MLRHALDIGRMVEIVMAVDDACPDVSKEARELAEVVTGQKLLLVPAKLPGMQHGHEQIDARAARPIQI